MREDLLNVKYKFKDKIVIEERKVKHRHPFKSIRIMFILVVGAVLYYLFNYSFESVLSISRGVEHRSMKVHCNEFKEWLDNNRNTGPGD